MADFNQFGSAKPPQFGDAQHCAKCEAMLADALDGTLSPADQAAFDLHMVGCESCAGMLADAQRGASWMEMLKSPRPEPPAALLERILAQTSVQAAKDARPAIVLGGNDYLRTPPVRNPNTILGRPMPASSAAAITSAALLPTNVLPFRTRFTSGLRSLGHTMLQPRLAMTAAMAFFSIALTMNLTGVHLSSLRASDLKPSSILRSCYETKARVVRYSDNLQFVYELESRVRDLQRSSDEDSLPASNSSQPAANPPKNNDQQQPADPNQKQTRPRPGPGSSSRENPTGNIHSVNSAHGQASRPAAAVQALVVLLPSVSKKQEGESV